VVMRESHDAGPSRRRGSAPPRSAPGWRGQGSSNPALEDGSRYCGSGCMVSGDGSRERQHDTMIHVMVTASR